MFATPASELASKKKSKHNSKSKKDKDSRKSQPVITEDTEVDPRGAHWAYQPPEGSVLYNHNVDTGDFDWDEVNDNDDLELWMIRVPESVKTKHLENMSLSMPSSSKSAHVGTISRKHTNYDVWSIRASNENAQNQDAAVGGEELLGLSCLLPRKKKGGKLYSAPKPIAHHLIISAQNSLPTPDPSSPESPTAKSSEGSRRYCHPKQLLKHRFLPYGSSTASSAPPGASMDVDEPPVLKKGDSIVEPTVQRVSSKEGKTKKRKVQGETPKKTKKVKTGA